MKAPGLGVLLYFLLLGASCGVVMGVGIGNILWR